METNKLLSIIKSIKAGNYDAAHDDAALLQNCRLGRDIQLAIQTDHDERALTLAETAFGLT